MKTNELLRRYVDERSESAFEKLVRQHIDWVYSAALRQVYGDVPTAQDVTQAVFTDLARKAPRLIQHPSLAGWLYTSIRFLAAKARRAEQCRRSYEQEAHEMNQLLPPDPDESWRELRPLLDDAIHDLAAKDREAVLMRYFERLPLAEIGARLGLKENAARMRIERALDRLRAALAKRGVVSTITALNAVLTGRAASAAPTGLAAQVSRRAFAAAAAGSGIGWALLRLAGLSKGGLLGLAAGVALAAGLATVPKLLTRNDGPLPTGKISGARREQAAAPRASADLAVAGADGEGSAHSPAMSNKLVLHLVASDTAKPIAGATVLFNIRENDETTWLRTPSQTAADKLGVCEIPLSRDTVAAVSIAIRTDGYVDKIYVWNPEHGERIPRQYTLRLETAAPIGGLVVDEEGKPISGANVTVQAGENSALEDNPYPPHTYIAATEGTVTDTAGRWRIDRFSKNSGAMLNLEVAHPDYLAEMGTSSMNDPETKQQLSAGAYVYKLDRGMAVSGIVVDTAGQPVAGARMVASAGGRPKKTTNQLDGTFTLIGRKGAINQISAEAPGFALATINVEITNSQAPLRLELRRGNRLRLRVVDAHGAPVPNATVRLNSNHASFGVRNGISEQTDANGRVSWDSAPENTVLFSIHANGYARVENIRLKADGEEHLVSLHSDRTISGTVRDAAIGQPVARFRIVTGVAQLTPSGDGTNVQWGKTRTFHDGTFRFENDSPGAGVSYKIEAEGYAPFVTRAVGPGEDDISFDIVLYRAVATTITVLRPDGQPAANASIGLDMPGTHLDSNLKPGGFKPTAEGYYKNVFSADDAGRFILPPDDSVTRVVVASPNGYAESTPTALAAASTIRLQPWGRIEGTFLSGGKPVGGQVLTLGRLGPLVSIMSRFFNVETEADGHFVFPKVPFGQFRLFQQKARAAYQEYSQLPVPPVTVRLGETTSVSVALNP